MCYSQQRCLWLTLLWSLMMMSVIIITAIIFIIIITTKTKFWNLIDYNYLSLISALIGQCNRKIRVITRALQRLFFTLLATKMSKILVVWLKKKSLILWQICIPWASLARSPRHIQSVLTWWWTSLWTSMLWSIDSCQKGYPLINVIWLFCWQQFECTTHWRDVFFLKLSADQLLVLIDHWLSP